MDVKKQLRNGAILLPATELVPLSLILGLHPVVLDLLRSHPPEPLPKTKGLAHETLATFYCVPRIGLVPAKEPNTFWVVTGIRAYQLVKISGLNNQIPCSIYVKLPEAEIAELAESDYLVAPYIAAPPPRVLHAHAHFWEENTEKLCAPGKQRNYGADVLAHLLGIDARRFSDIKSKKNAEKSETPSISTDKQSRGKVA